MPAVFSKRESVETVQDCDQLYGYVMIIVVKGNLKYRIETVSYTHLTLPTNREV